MICLHCNRDILAYQDRIHVANGGYVHQGCYPRYQDGRQHNWVETVIAVFIILVIVAVVYLND
jgi:hypothetical protein